MSKNIIIIGVAFIGLSIFLWWKFGKPVADNSEKALSDRFKLEPGTQVFY